VKYYIFMVIVTGLFLSKTAEKTPHFNAGDESGS